MNIKRYANYGTVESDAGLFSFEIVGQGSALELDELINKGLNNSVMSEYQTMQIGDFLIAPYDRVNNNLPFEIRETIKKNHILPEIIEKQIRFLYGSGPYLYTETISETNIIRTPVRDAEIEAWLNSWKANGLANDYRKYLMRVIREYYYTEGIFIKRRNAKASRLGPGKIAGLEVVPVTDARFATTNKKYYNELVPFDERDFNYVLVGNWLNPTLYSFDVYNKFDESNPFKYGVSINYAANDSFGEKLYSLPVYYEGLKDWIKGSNATPKQLLSFFRNLLTAKFHVKIPSAWLDARTKTLQGICQKNVELKEATKPLIKEFDGVKMVDDNGNALEFRESMVSQAVNFQLKRITTLMTGEENAGKLFSSIKYHTEYGLEEWEIEEIPHNIKNFIDSVIAYDKRAIEAILEGKGVDASISNVSKDGIISNSGSNVYYNYLIYMNSLAIPEFICTYDINNAIQLNFPEKKNIKLGFYHNLPARQQDVSPANRLTTIQPGN